MTKYALVEVFATLQGEGMQAGTAAVFVRFGGCNLWSGHDEHRQRDHQRSGSACTLFCDTDFRQATKFSMDEICEQILAAGQKAKMHPIPLIVLTGGEPLLQVDKPLLDAIKKTIKADIAVETNGTISPKDGVVELLDWICVSPKKKDEDIVVRRGDELKIVFPDYNPVDYAVLAEGFRHCLVQPTAKTQSVGDSSLDPHATQAAAQFCQQNPEWRLSLQTHKVIGLP